MLIEKNDLNKVKESLNGHIGQKIKLTAKKGRKRVVVRHGILESTYPSIFTVKLDNVSEYADTTRTVCFSYADVLTNTIEITLPNGNELV